MLVHHFNLCDCRLSMPGNGTDQSLHEYLQALSHTFLACYGNTPLVTRLCVSCAYVGLDSPRCEFITFSYTRAWKGRTQSRLTVFSSEPPENDSVASLQPPFLVEKPPFLIEKPPFSCGWKCPLWKNWPHLMKVILNYKLRIVFFFFCSEQLEVQFVSHADGWPGRQRSGRMLGGLFFLPLMKAQLREVK